MHSNREEKKKLGQGNKVYYSVSRRNLKVLHKRAEYLRFEMSQKKKKEMLLNFNVI